MDHLSFASFQFISAPAEGSSYSSPISGKAQRERSPVLLRFVLLLLRFMLIEGHETGTTPNEVYCSLSGEEWLWTGASYAEKQTCQYMPR